MLARQPSSDVTPEMYSGIFREWAPFDTDAAVSQLNFMLETDERNAAIQGILQSPGLDPGLVDQLYQRIEGADARQRLAQMVYYRLSEEDPERAERYRVLGRLPSEPETAN